jgi:hypothetical protein
MTLLSSPPIAIALIAETVPAVGLRPTARVSAKATIEFLGGHELGEQPTQRAR